MSYTDPKSAIGRAGKAIREGGVAIFPTDTFFALGVNAMSPDAVRQVFALKGRGERRPMPVLLAAARDVTEVARDVPALAYRLAERFWPGPLTLVVPRRADVPPAVSGGFDTIGVRVPDHPVALDVLEAAGVPVTGTSANPSGEPPTKDIEQIRGWFGESVHAIVESACGAHTVPSTVLDLTEQHPVIRREGGVSMADLRELVPDITIGPSR